MVAFSLSRGTWKKSNVNYDQRVQDTLGLRNSHGTRDLSSRLPLPATQGHLVFREVLMLAATGWTNTNVKGVNQQVKDRSRGRVTPLKTNGVRLRGPGGPAVCSCGTDPRSPQTRHAGFDLNRFQSKHYPIEPVIPYLKK